MTASASDDEITRLREIIRRLHEQVELANSHAGQVVIERDELRLVADAVRRYVAADDALRAHTIENEEHAGLYGVWVERFRELKEALQLFDQNGTAR